MKRLSTAIVAASLAVTAVFLLPSLGFFVVCVLAIEWAVVEFVRLGRHWSTKAPMRSLLLLVPGAAAVIGFGIPVASDPPWSRLATVTVALAMIWICSVIVLSSSTPVAEMLPAVTLMSFALPYFALPAVSLHALHSIDPWLVILLFAIVWSGDSVAYYTGSAWGRHKMAPRVSPNKSWEGAAGSVAGALIACAVWSQWRLGTVEVPLLVIAVVTNLAAQFGDLLESVIKRGAGVKDSGAVLPGHGGVLDRIDALLAAAPVFFLAILLNGAEGLVS